MVRPASIRISRGVTQWARQPSEFAREIEGTDCVFMNGGTAVAQAGHRGIDCFPVTISAPERHIETT